VIQMELQEKKINRQVDFLYAQPYNSEDSTGANNTWKYNRAPEGYKFVLHSIEVSVAQTASLFQGLVAMYDGHEYTHWNQFPGVESKELLTRGETNVYILNLVSSLNGWECKEYTLGIRSLSATYGYKVCIIVWYYLEKMSKLEEYQYATIQPKGDKPIRKAGATTVESTEE